MAQSVPRPPVIGFLTLAASGGQTLLRVRAGLRELGYEEGRNVEIVTREAAGLPERLPAMASELARTKVAVICAIGPQALRAARGATSAVPIVAYDLETDPVRAGLVRSLGRPGGNVTGAFLDIPAVAGKWLQLIQDAVPGRHLTGLLWDSTTGESQLASAREAARSLDVPLYVAEIRRVDDFEGAIAKSAAAGVRRMAMLSSPTISGFSERLARACTAHRLPAVSPFSTFPANGGLLSYGPEQDDMRNRLAPYLDKILKGARAGELPIQQPSRFELVVNAKTARELGLALPQALLLRADVVIS